MEELINDAYWLKYAKEKFDSSIKSRDEAASKLETFSTFLWTTYTAAFAIAAAFNTISDNPWKIIILVLPIILLLMTKYLCTYVQMPVDTDIDTVDPDKIANAHAEIVHRKIIRLRFAVVFSFVSTISLISSLITYKIPDKNETISSLREKAEEQNAVNDQLKTLKLYYEINNEYLKAKTDSYKNYSEYMDKLNHERDSLNIAVEIAQKKSELKKLK